LTRDHRRLAAIVLADVAGYTRLMGHDDSGTLAALKTHRRELIDPKITEYDGRIVKTMGDGLLLEFPSVVDAVRCSVDVQRAMAERNADVPTDNRIDFRIGINVGDIIIDGDDIFGEGVNVAARLEALAEPGGICMSGKVYNEVAEKLDCHFEDRGLQRVKNIALPVRVYALGLVPKGTSIVPEVVRSSVTAEGSRLYGRAEDLSALRSLIEQNALITVVGPGGIGKTRLAEAIAHDLRDRFPERVMVELASLADPALVVVTVARALGLVIGDARTALDLTVQALAGQRLLLVLDNCEHLLEAVDHLVAALRRGAPDVHILATSQELLRHPDEHVYRLGTLALPAEPLVSTAREAGAVELFVARAQAVEPRFLLTDENVGAVVEICRRLDGIPLAIELAAARVPLLGVEGVRERLDERFRLLTAGSRLALRRHQTLRAALEWSYSLLSEPEQAVFEKLGVFAGSFSLESAQKVTADERMDEWAVLDHLGALVDKSLLVADASDAPRYRLLESARAFALEQLAAGETADTLKRHALAMRDFLERVDGANLDGELRSDQYAALVLPELDNLRAAHAWATGEAGDPRVAIGLAAHAGALIDYAVECVDWLLPLRQHVEDGVVDPAVAARYWRAIAANNMGGRVPRALQVEASCRAQSLYQALGQPRRVFSSLMQLSGHRSAQRHDAAAQAALDEARSLVRPDWPAEFRIRLLRRDGSLARDAGRFTEALALFHDVVRVSASTGDWRLEVIARSNLADLLWQIGPIEEAAHVACKLAEELRARPAAYSDMDVLFANVVGILSEMGRIDEASAAACEALPIMRRTQRSYIEEWVYLFWRRGKIDTATLLLGASDAQCVRAGHPLQPNEERLIAEARAALEARLPPDAFASGLAAGASLGEGEMLALISEALAQPSANHR
jgi:predicted ATPase/class 3 adenylate cyclase